MQTRTKILMAALLLGGSGADGQAADLTPRVYTKAPIGQIYDWTGFYVGANAGIGLSRNLTSLAVGAAPAERSYLGGPGAIGGAQVGYNWQAGNVVFGLEADIQGAGMRDDRTCLLTCRVNDALQFDQRLDWFGTARGRLGLATGSVLSYVTGGFAFGDVRTTVNETFLGVPGNGATFSETRSGWTVGSGVEASLGGNWTGKVEYLYLDLGAQSGGYTAVGTDHSYNSDIREHIFRVGLNYRIGATGAAIAEPVANWAGGYIGGNVGDAVAMNPSSAPIDFPNVGIDNNEQFNFGPRGVIGGAQIGYNWQAANWVFGLESDIQGSAQKDNDVCQFFCSTGALNTDQRMQWLGTTRARLGYATGSSLFYVSGGAAYGGVKLHVAETPQNGQPASDFVFAHTKTGWTMGGGIETAFNPFNTFGRNWTAKAEYLYVNLGGTTDSFDFAGNTVALTSHLQEHIFRTGLNYHFGG